MKKILAYLGKKSVSSKLIRFLNPNWYKDAVGGMWDEIGKLQFEFLVKEGLKPDHFLIDVGCGSLRGGVRFIRYLEAGRYFGIDMDGPLLEAGKNVLTKNKLMHKKPTLAEMSDFNLPFFSQTFDYALAQSLFTHLPLNSIIRCVMNIEKVLVRGGRFYATFFEHPEGKENLDLVMHSLTDTTKFPTYFDKDPYHYDFETFKWVCEGTKLRAERIGDWGHPRDQRMMVFIKM